MKFWTRLVLLLVEGRGGGKGERVGGVTYRREKRGDEID